MAAAISGDGCQEISLDEGENLDGMNVRIHKYILLALMIIYQVQIDLGPFMEHTLHELYDMAVGLVPFMVARTVPPPSVLVLEVYTQGVVDDAVSLLTAGGDLPLELVDDPGVDFGADCYLIYHTVTRLIRQPRRQRYEKRPKPPNLFATFFNK